MAIENSVSNDFYLRSSIVFTFSIAAYPLWEVHINFNLSEMPDYGHAYGFSSYKIVTARLEWEEAKVRIRQCEVSWKYPSPLREMSGILCRLLI